MGNVGVRRRAFAPISSDVADGGNRADNPVGNRQRVSVNYCNHIDNHIEEVINGNNGLPEFPAITGRLEQPANRQ